MSGKLVDRMLRQPGARFTWRMTSQDHGLIAYGQGTVDFPAEKVATLDHYVVADESAPGGSVQETEPPAARTITTKDAVFVLAPTEDADQQWLAIETGGGGLSTSVLAPILWLRGSAIDHDDDRLPAGEHSITINLRDYLNQLGSTERASERDTLEFGRVGLSQEQILAAIHVTESGLVGRMTASIPSGVSPLVPVGHEQVEQEITLEWLPGKPVIPTPDAQMKVAADEFIHATLIESGVPGWNVESE